jgi:mannan polymerase II complex MNN10 subunit
MKIIFTSLHDSNYKGLADKTLDNNKVPYCIKYGYPLIVKTNNWYNIPIGYEKAFLIQTAFTDYPDCEWVFFSECDTLITNMDIKLEDIVKDEQKHFVITTDINGINAGSFFVRNTVEGRGYIQSMVDSIGRFAHEQAFIIDSYFYSKTHTDIISLYPQKSFNSYDYYIFGGTYPSGLDYFGNNGRWTPGDFIIHFPGCTLEHRISLVDSYLPQIINTIST